MLDERNWEILNEVERKNVENIVDFKIKALGITDDNGRRERLKKIAEFYMINSVKELIQVKEEMYNSQLDSDPRILDFLDGYSSLEVVNFYDSVILNPYIPVAPFFQQIQLLMSRGRVLYGGKSEACLMGALQYVEFF